MYELFEHTADLGLRVEADHLDELFADAARGLFAMLLPRLDEVRKTRQFDFRCEGAELDYLLLDWLNELLFLFESQHVVLGDFQVQVSSTGLTAQAWGEPLDLSRHPLEHEVKAITYHGLHVEQRAGRWWAEVIVDI